MVSFLSFFKDLFQDPQQKVQNLFCGQGAIFLPCFRVNRQAIVRLGCRCWRNCFRCGCVCICAAQLCGFALEPDLIFCICFHGLFFSALLCVFCPSPFTKKPRPQPSFVGVVFRGHHERRAGVLGKAVRARGRRRKVRKKDLNNTRSIERSEQNQIGRRPLGDGRGQASGMGGGFWGSRPGPMTNSAKRLRWREGCLRAGAMTATRRG